LRRFRLASRHTASGDLVFATTNGRSIGDRNLDGEDSRRLALERASTT
jgi:hypothetical protein